MFKSKDTLVGSAATTLISCGTEVIGDIKFTGSLEIEGTVKGNVYAAEGADASVRIQDSGKIEGQIRVPTVVVNGTVVGDVYSSKHVELASKASVEGNVHYALIEMVKGAQVNGSLIYSGEGAKQKSRFDNAGPKAVVTQPKSMAAAE